MTEEPVDNKCNWSETQLLLSVLDEMQMPVECPASVHQGLAADLRVIYLPQY